jgi:chorismate mutase
MGDQAMACCCAGLDNATAMGSLNTLAGLVIQRLDLARDVAAIKYDAGRPIEDSGREQEILESVARALEGFRDRQEAALQFARDQIEANKVIQRELHQRWYAHPEEVPATYRDLAAEIRPQLNVITTRMLREFTLMDEVPRVSGVEIRRLTESQLAARRPVPQLPGLHRNAALFALRTFIRPVTAGADW